MAIMADQSLVASRHPFRHLSRHLLAGFGIAVLAHLAIFITFPSLTPSRVIQATLQSGATILHIAIAPPKPQPAPTRAAAAPSAEPKAKTSIKEPSVKKPLVKKAATPKAPLPKANTSLPDQPAAPPPPAPSTVKSATAPAPIPTTHQVNLRSDRIAPTYPKRALRMKQEGTVMLKILVDKNGSQKHIQLARSSQFPLLDRAAIDAVRQWRFHPTLRNGEAIISWVQVPIEFQIR